jgi:hypothetical protein
VYSYTERSVQFTAVVTGRSRNETRLSLGGIFVLYHNAARGAGGCRVFHL